MAISGLTAIKEMNKTIDEDFLVIAYDDRDVFKLHTPPISAIEQPMEAIAESMISLILNELSVKTEANDNQVILPAKLVLR